MLLKFRLEGGDEKEFDVLKQKKDALIPKMSDEEFEQVLSLCSMPQEKIYISKLREGAAK